MFRDNCSASRSLQVTKLTETIVLVEVSNQTSTPNNGNQIMHHKDSTCESDCACSTCKRAKTNMIEARYPGWRRNTSHSHRDHVRSGRAFWTWDTWTMSIEASESTLDIWNISAQQAAWVCTFELDPIRSPRATKRAQWTPVEPRNLRGFHTLDTSGRIHRF